MNRSEREVLWLRKVRDVSRELAREHDLDRLLPLILDAAIEITDAERGFLVRVRRDGEHLQVHVEVARGFNRGQLESDASSVSRTVVQRVLDQGEPLVTTREQDAVVLDVSSVISRRVIAICCVPLRLRGEIAGVLYLDHRLVANAFNVEDLPVLSVFADQAALAIETAELRADTAKLTDNLRELREVGQSAEQTASRPRQLFGRLTGVSPSMCELYAVIERVARSRDPVLILGESGTGKQLVAQELHARGELPNQPFLEQVCAAAAEPALERALFGERGRAGALLEAERGTLLLIEVADLPPALQARLAAALRERVVHPAAGGRPQRLACRVVATSTRDLREEVEAGRFREDLYYRLDVQRLELPPLRQRREDFALLLDHFARVHGGRSLPMTDNARSLLVRYAWPGNVRELENEVRRLVALDLERISARQLSPEIREGRGVSTARGALSGRTLEEVEKEMIVAALADANGNKAKAARQLGVPRSSLYGLMQRHGIE